ncbi:MAG: hypothetical protein M3P93_10550 [Actinomycetota bacterium]|nr:hypothetical protein [Actinomycetota bacterium]
MAQRLGYANRGTVHRIVQQALSAREVESVDELRHLELARLDAVQSPLWPRAMAGEPSAASSSAGPQHAEAAAGQITDVT